MIRQEEVIPIGSIRRTHGKQGEVQCAMQNEYWDNADADFLILQIDHILVPFRVTDWRGKGSDCLIFRLDGINDEKQAMRLIGAEVFMLRKDVAEEESAPMTWQDLVGYTVCDTEQGYLGCVTEVDESTANTLLSLNGKKGNVLIPIHEDFILDIDEKKKVLHINLPYIL